MWSTGVSTEKDPYERFVFGVPPDKQGDYAISDAKNDFTLNLPRYIDSSEPEDRQDIDGHLRRGIPNRDIDALDRYWQVIPGVRNALFKKGDRSGYSQLRIPAAEIKPNIFGHEEFTTFNAAATKLFAKWRKANAPQLNGFAKDGHPKQLIEALAEDLLATFEKAPLLDPYDIYQHLMDYWAATMQDDCYLIAADGWRKATEPRLIIEDKEKDKKNKVKVKPRLRGWQKEVPDRAASASARDRALLREGSG